tara:strand:+ start:1575 stop:2015 length:441 start_codon:yes stop_codon:yes gene_type:complete
MAALTHVQVLDRVATVVTAGTSLVQSDELLDPRWAPEANLDRAFTVTPRSISNTGLYRERTSGQERARYQIELVCVWQTSVHEYSATRDTALGDTLAAIQALLSDTSASSRDWFIQHTDTTLEVHESREWLFGSVGFNVDADVSFT